MQSIKAQRIIYELRTGYCRLDEYRYKTGLQGSSNCRCGDRESVQHFIEDCELYGDICEDKDKEALFNVAYNVTDNISS